MQKQAGPLEVTLIYDREDGVPLTPPRRVSVSITPDLAGVFARAAVVNLEDTTPLSFTSLLVGLVTAPDSWLEKELLGQRVEVSRIGSRRGRSYDPEKVRSVDAGSMAREYLASESARRAIEKAGAIAEELKADHIDWRHLTAAYPVLENWHLQDFAELGIDRLAWCRAFGAEMARLFHAEKWYWVAYADRAAPVPLTSFSADVYTETDLLGIDRTVDALALLIASTHTHTPLSIGVFGPWGSGKTFFMRHLQKRIMGLAKHERGRAREWDTARKQGVARAEGAPRYFGQVAQVEFNAWHYNDSNLFASLVEHLFRNLRVLHPDSEDPELQQRQAEALLQLSGVEAVVKDATAAIRQARESLEAAKADVARTTGAAESARHQVDEKARELEDTRGRLDGERGKLDDAIRELAVTPKGIDARALMAVALRPLSPLVGRAREAGEEVEAATQSWATFFERALSPRGLLVVALCIGAPLVAALNHWLTDLWATVAGMATTAFAGYSNALAAFSERRTQFESKLQELEKEEADNLATKRGELERERDALDKRRATEVAAFGAKLEDQRAALVLKEKDVNAAVQALAERTKELDQRVQARAAAEAKLQEVDAHLKRLSSALLLEEFIKDRSATDDYRKQLGFLALVRRDFERLSDLVAKANKEWTDPAKKSAPPLLNRIVLYIDDLDRCKEKTVLEVLEAVHLLLAFPLFVCAVGVDPRWVEKCLRRRHQHLFADETVQAASATAEAPDPGAAALDDSEIGHATVGDYLEKIFQIPIWMSPIDERQRAALVRSLLGRSASPDAPRRGRASVSGDARPADGGGGPGSGPPRSDAFKALVEKASESPDPLLITHDEALFVDQVAALLSERPRALKRFVNIYRLLKASLSEIDRGGFVSAGPASPYRICISQLAVFTGQPRLAPVLVRELERSTDGTTNLAQWFDALPQGLRTPLQGAFDHIPDRASISVDAFRTWLPCTSRYLFHRAD